MHKKFWCWLDEAFEIGQQHTHCCRIGQHSGARAGWHGVVEVSIGAPAVYLSHNYETDYHTPDNILAANSTVLTTASLGACDSG